MKKILFTAVLAVSLLLGGCGVEPSVQNDKITVCTSFNAMYQFAEYIAGDKANVECLMPSGAEPHDWEPSATDIVKLENADVFVYSSDNMESWAKKVINSVENEELTCVETQEGTEEISNETHLNEKPGHIHSENGDPHIWLNPQNAIVQMQNITDALCSADADNTEFYKANMLNVKKRLEELDAKYKKALTGIKNNKIIVSHEAYGYLCKAYGLEQIGIKGIMAENEPSPAKMAEIVKLAKENNIKYVFAESEENTKFASIVADEINGEVLILNPFENSSEDYFTVMENNLTALQKALGNGE